MISSLPRQATLSDREGRSVIGHVQRGRHRYDRRMQLLIVSPTTPPPPPPPVMASLDSILENVLAGSGAKSASEALILALHSDLLAEGFVCVALGDDVWLSIL